MNSSPHPVSPRALAVHAIALAALLAFAVAASGCRDRPHPAEPRAIEFITALVSAPGDAARLDALSRGRTESIMTVLYNDLRSKVALEYLQSRARQGVATRYHVTDRTMSTPDRCTVRVAIEQGREPDTSVYRFNVELEAGEDDAWFVNFVSSTS